MKILNCLFLTIGIIGALNWGLIGLLDFNLVNFLFSFNYLIERFIYILVGVAGLYMLFFYPKITDSNKKMYM